MSAISEIRCDTTVYADQDDRVVESVNEDRDQQILCVLVDSPDDGSDDHDEPEIEQNTGREETHVSEEVVGYVHCGKQE